MFRKQDIFLQPIDSFPPSSLAACCAYWLSTCVTNIAVYLTLQFSPISVPSEAFLIPSLLLPFLYHGIYSSLRYIHIDSYEMVFYIQILVRIITAVRQSTGSNLKRIRRSRLSHSVVLCITERRSVRVSISSSGSNLSFVQHDKYLKRLTLSISILYRTKLTRSVCASLAKIMLVCFLSAT